MILYLSLWEDCRPSFICVVSKQELLDNLVKWGQQIFFIDGTWHVVENGLQVVPLMIRHPSGLFSFSVMTEQVVESQLPLP